jgi:hypothetical protein
LLPSLFASIYLVMRRLANPVAGMVALWMAMLSFAWMLQVAGALASGLALIELLWLMAAVHERRVLAASALLALMFYTHLGLSWVAVASLVCWVGLGAVPRGRVIPVVLGAGLLMAAPWIWHVASHAGRLQVAGRNENQTLDVLPALYALAMYGGWICWRQRGAARLLPGLWLGFCLMAPAFRFRWLSGEGLLPVILLAVCGLAPLVERVKGLGLPRWAGRVVVAGALALSPSVLVQESRMKTVWFDTAPFHLLYAPVATPKVMDVRLHTHRTVELARSVAQATQPGEILWSNASYAGGLVAALANRPTSSAMFYEVPPAKPFDQVGAAHWIVWFKIPMPDMPPLQDLVDRYHLTLTAQDELAWMLRNPSATQLAHAPHACIPWELAFMLLCMILGFIIFGFRKDTWPK